MVIHAKTPGRMNDSGASFVYSRLAICVGVCGTYRLITSAAATATAAGATIFTGSGFIDRQFAVVLHLAIKGLDGCVGFFVRAHLDETEPFAPTTFAIFNHKGAVHRTERREHAF